MFDNRADSALLRHGRWAALAVAFALLLPMARAAADPENRLDRIERRQDAVRSKLAGAQRDSAALLDRIQLADAERADAQAEVERYNARLAELNERISVVQGDLADAQIQLAAVTEELDGIEQRLQRRVDAYTAHAIAAYKAGPSAAIEGLLAAPSFGDLVDRYEYYESALDADTQLVAEIEALRAETEARREIVEAKRAQIAETKRRLEGDRDVVEGIRAQRARVLARIERALSEKKKLLAEVKARKNRYETILDQLERESDQIASLLATSSAGPMPSGGGQLLWPVAGPMTSGYGYRTHPIFGDRRFHSGIDIGAPYGAPVIAADAGQVVFVGTMSGYGNVVIVDHGGGLATTYNHLSGFSVGTGESVRRGQQVASVGCTGYCTGPHLHFEVRVDGNPVDPMPYLQ